MNSDYKFCFHCQNIFPIEEFKIRQDPKLGVQILNCTTCRKDSFEVTCPCGKQNLYPKVDQIFKCSCKMEFRLYICQSSSCKRAQRAKQSPLKQSSIIQCECLSKVYMINCPQCSELNITPDLLKITQCSQCKWPFKLRQCQECQGDAWSTNGNTYQCKEQKDHVFQTLKCPQCSKEKQLSVGTNYRNKLIMKCCQDICVFNCNCGEQNLSTKKQIVCKSCQTSYELKGCCSCDGFVIIDPSYKTVELMEKCIKCQKKHYLLQCDKCNYREFSLNANTSGDCPKCTQSLEKNPAKCPTCYEGTPDQVILPCMHICVCKDCGVKIQNQDNKCPICKVNIESIKKVFFQSQ